MDKRKDQSRLLPTRVPTETWEQPGLQGSTTRRAPGARCGPQGPPAGSGCRRIGLCAQTDPKAGRPRNGEESAAPRGGGALFRDGSPALQPGSGAPRAGPDPLPLRRGLRSRSPDAPAPPRAGRQGPGTLHPPDPRCGGRGRPAPKTPRRPRGPRPGSPSAPSGRMKAGTGIRAAGPGSSCASAPGSEAQRCPQLPASAARAPGREAGGPEAAPKAGALDPGAQAPRPSRPLCGAQAVRLRLPLRPCARPERPLPPAAAPGRLEAPRRPSPAPQRSPGRGLCGRGPVRGLAAGRRARPLSSWSSHPASSPACSREESGRQAPWRDRLRLPGTGLGAFVPGTLGDPAGGLQPQPHSSQRPL